MPPLCVLTAYDARFAEIAALSVPRLRAFADAQGHALRVVERNDCARRGGWLKIEPIRDALAAGFEHVLWIDADALIVREGGDIRAAARADADLAMAWHEPAPHSSGDAAHFNTGVMLIRATDWSRQFFARVWETGPLAHRWNDQAAILHLLGFDGVLELGADRPDEPNRAHVARLDIAWNSIPGVCAAPDPIVRHYAGVGDLAAREGQMRWEVEWMGV